jgi:hypothetical protein
MKVMHVMLVIQLGKKIKNMKIFISMLFLIISVSNAFGQEVIKWRSGKVSFSNSQNVYVNFETTSGISAGDTLYTKIGEDYYPALKVKFTSSISCVCEAIQQMDWVAEMDIFSMKTAKTEEIEVISAMDTSEINKPTSIVELEEDAEESSQTEQKIRGRLSVSSYTNLEGYNELSSQRMRYAFSLTGDHLKSSKFSVQNYIVFRHRLDEPIANTDDLFDALKIYNLAFGFQPNEKNDFWIGRKVNDHITNIGALDGIQYSRQLKKIRIGGFVGTRPDYSDYRITFDLPQAGIYLAHRAENSKGYAKSTVSFVEQMNSGATDRRFLYFQHSNSMVKNVHIFSSFELDLFTVDNGKASSTLIPTSLYVSLRYRPFRKLTIFGAYDNRRRVIYYESYKSFIDQLLEEETRQGFRLRIQYRLFKKLSLGASGVYRFQKDSEPTKNIYGYATISRIPGLKMSSTFSYNYLETSYLQGMIIGFRGSRDLVRGKLSSSFQYRYVDYTYNSSETKLVQHIGGVNLSWRIQRTISMSLNYEGSFQPDRIYNRIYINAVKRFR